MKQMLLFIFLLSSVSISHSMDKMAQPTDKKIQLDTSRAAWNNECSGCYFGHSVPACVVCVTKRNNSEVTPQAGAKAVAIVKVKNDLSKSQEMNRCP